MLVRGYGEYTVLVDLRLGHLDPDAAQQQLHALVHIVETWWIAGKRMELPFAEPSGVEK